MSGQFTFTAADVVDQVQALAAQRPDYVYRPPSASDRCSYVTGEDGQGCIVGQALMHLGVPRERLAQMEAEAPLLANLLLRALIGTDPREPEAAWLAWAQGEQDVGIPWGAAVESADREKRARARLQQED